MERYDSYRLSEIPCLGAVPSHWKQSKFKFHHIEEDVLVGEYSDDYPLLSLTKEGVVFRDVESGKGKFPATFENYKVVHPNVLIFCLFDIDETPRTIGLSDHFGMITGAYKLFRTTRDLNPRFSLYTFLVIDNVKGLKPYYTGLRKVVRPETFKSIEFAVPPVDEQERIVEYLDRKTALIDSLIEKTGRKIELLKEKRTSLINEVVTKGLDPDVVMKDSGVEWIGEIPRHWDVKKLKYLSNIEYGISPPDTTYNDNGVGVVLVNGPVEYSTTDFGYTRSLKWTTEPKKFTLKDSLLFCLRGSTTGRMNITHMDVSIGRGVCSIRSHENQWFLTYSMFSIRIWIQEQIGGSTFPSVTSDDVNNYRICSPPVDEQERIVEYLDEQTAIIDSTITKEEKRIELLKEYRQSLISEVVTGKVKVA
jgi:type I restriction enzyme S subunit